MKVRAIEELEECLNDDFRWRMEELKLVNMAVQDASGSHVSTHLRAGIVLLYAHWEGFVKFASEAYLTYVATKAASQKFKYHELQRGFLALALQKNLPDLPSTTKSSLYLMAVSFVIDKMLQRADIPDQNMIDTQSNLRSHVLKGIWLSIGLDVSPYELYFTYIDEKLVDRRNDIAHGKRQMLKKQEFIEVYELITDMLKRMKNEMINAAVRELYRNSSAIDIQYTRGK